jgi:hypothetical protein
MRSRASIGLRLRPASMIARAVGDEPVEVVSDSLGARAAGGVGPVAQAAGPTSPGDRVSARRPMSMGWRGSGRFRRLRRRTG